MRRRRSDMEKYDAAENMRLGVPAQTILYDAEKLC